jgi:hypothetical protein
VKRLKLLLVLATMPDEAFGWLTLAIQKFPGRANVWPDGIGGFKPESRAAIEAARHAAAEYNEGGDEPPASR